MKKRMTKIGCLLMTGAMVSSLAAVPVLAEDNGADIEPCTIYFMNNSTSSSMNDLYDHVVEAFNEVYPDITVEIQTGASDYYSVLSTKINAGEVPDIFITMGYKDLETYGDYMYDLAEDEDLKAVFDDLKEGYTDGVVASNGKICGVPYSLQGYGYVYNKGLFEQAGIETLPTTYDEMVEVCEKLEAAGIKAFANGYKEDWIYKHSFSAYVGESFDSLEEMQQQLTDGTTTFSDLDKMDDMFDMLDLVIEYGVDKQLELDAAAAVSLFGSGQAAMMNQGNWSTADILAIDPEIEVGFIPEPIGNDASLSKLNVSGTGCYSISKDTENFEAAKAFYLFMIDYMCTQEEGVNIMPMPMNKTDISLLTDPLGLAALNAESVRGWAQNYWPSGFEGEFGALLQEYTAGNMTREEVLTDMQSNWDKLSQ